VELKSIGRSIVVGLALFVGGSAVLFPAPARAARHNHYPETADCSLCHSLAALLAEDNTAYLRAGARTLPTMKTLNRNRPPSMRTRTGGPDGVGCTFCHYNTGNRARMKDVLDQFNGKPSQHPVDRAYTLASPPGIRKISLGLNTNTTRWMSGWDDSWRRPANQLGCIDCHEVRNTTSNAGSGEDGYPEHPDPSDRGENPVMLKGGARSWRGGHSTDAFCLETCHAGTAPGTSGYRMGHYGWGAYDNTGLKDSNRIRLRTSKCVDCHETHYSGSQRNLFGELGDNGRLLRSQSNNLVEPANCTALCHDDANPTTVGHGRPKSSAGRPMGVGCPQCHTTSVPHRDAKNPRRLFREDPSRATLSENLAGNGIDDDFDGVIDNPGESALKRSGESDCTNGSCHQDHHLHAGTGKLNGAPASASCLHCHEVHGNGVGDNIRMIRSRIMGKKVRYQSSADFLRADAGGDVASLCDNPACHRKPMGAVGKPGTVLGDVPEHVQDNVGPGVDCTKCHPHASGPKGGSFLPK
jgi:hypothetical protein